MHVYLAVTCPINTSLNKKPLTLEEESEFPATLLNNCEPGERFDNGLYLEEIKCSAAERTGVWNHLEYSCDGNYCR